MKPTASLFFYFIRPCRSQCWGRLRPRAQNMKLAVSRLLIYQTSQVPALGAAQPTCTQAVPLCRFATFPPPRGGIFPKPLPALPFLVRRKGSKRLFKGTAVPLKIPCWGALWPPRTRAVPFCRYATFPPHCGGIVPSPTAGFLSGNNKHIESQEVRSLCWKISALYWASSESGNCPATYFACFGRGMFGILAV